MAFTVVKSRRCLITGTAETVTIPANRLCTIVHRGVGSDGTTAVTANLYVDTAGGTATVDNTAGEGLHTILSGESYPLPPGTTSFSIIATSTSTLAQIIASEAMGNVYS